VNGIDIPQVCHYFISEDAFNWAMSNLAHFVSITALIFVPLFVFSLLFFYSFANEKKYRKKERLEKAITKAVYLTSAVVSVFWFVNAVCLFRTCAY
jgi:hypothetical protein